MLRQENHAGKSIAYEEAEVRRNPYLADYGKRHAGQGMPRAVSGRERTPGRHCGQEQAGGKIVPLTARNTKRGAGLSPHSAGEEKSGKDLSLLYGGEFVSESFRGRTADYEREAPVRRRRSADDERTDAVDLRRMRSEEYRESGASRRSSAADYEEFSSVRRRMSQGSETTVSGRRPRPSDREAPAHRHHQAIIDYRTFATARALRESRSTAHYRGQKKYDNVYSGFLECGDCGSPMFAMSRRDIKDAYRCGEYHKRGLKACTSHHIRVDKLDEMLKIYVQKVKDNSAAMLDRLNADLEKEAEDVAETEQSAANLEAVLADLQEELKATKRQRIRDIMKHPEREETLEETYDELEGDLLRRMEGIQNQIAMTVDKRNTIIQVNRAAKTAMEVFDDILAKPKLDRNDLQLIIEKIRVYEDHIEVLLQADVDSILRSGTLPEEKPEAVAAMAPVSDRPYEIQITQESDRRYSKIGRASCRERV